MEYFRGGEAVLAQFGMLFPQASISVMVYNEQHLPAELLSHPFRTSLLQRWSLLRNHFRYLLPLFPEIIRSMRLPSDAHFVLSSDAAMIKGIPLPNGAIHVCYCHSPPRYLWGLEDSYLESASHHNRLGRLLFSASIPRLRAFDREMAQRVNQFIANSRCVQDRIRMYYDRDSVVVYPPVDVGAFRCDRPREDYYLVVSALVPYKRIDLAVEACARLGRRLIVIGTGPEEVDLRRRGGEHVTFMGWQSVEVTRDHFERCRAFLFPGIEDFGITPCEAQASGAPVIAFNQGGALETVRPGVTGIFFESQTVEALVEAIEHFEASPPFSSEACRANVRHLEPERFRRQIREFLEREYPEHFSAHEWPLSFS
ncbi:MAG TPA: glycosyltransferase [Opitutaceae bacterium]|jgi:glycosyltransferase involved in cell wall biosynthesis